MVVAIGDQERNVDAVRCPQEEVGLCPLGGPITDSGRPRKSSARRGQVAQKPIVILQHRAGCAPSSVTGFLNDGDRPWEVRRLWLGEPVPERPDDVSAVILLGGPMNVHEEADHSFLVAEKAFLRSAFAVDLPMLGICLGAQLLAEVGGGRVYRRDREEIGLVPIDLVADDPLFAGVESPFMAFESHSYSFTLPPGATPLARRPDGLQAFRLGNAWGLQFHPEVDADRARQWVEEQLSCNRTDAPLESDVAAAVRARTAALLPSYQQLCRRLMHNWLALVA
jgi:GMP synthase (glutamine-hydrolysing)